MLRDELPDWASMIAANLVIDGILTTWIASARDSSIEPLAQRARKILQEEGAHKVHAEAWCQAHLPRGRRRPRAAAAQRIGEAWEQAARWPGPDDDAGYREAVAAGMLACGPAEVRAQVRDWLEALLAAEGCAVELPEPQWSRDLPVLRVARRRGRRAVGRADHHAPGALPQLQHLLRGRPRRVRRAVSGW